MNLILALIFLAFGWLVPVSTSNYSQTQSRATDVERKTDINAMHAKLEEFYNENGYYPTDWDFGANQISHLEQLFPGADSEAFLDPQGLKIGQNGSDYAYVGQDCTYESASPAGSCQGYALSSKLDDGSRYEKQSLN